MKLLLLLFAVAICASCSNTYYIVRHAEKATAAPNMTTDVPLSAEGKTRAEALKNELAVKRFNTFILQIPFVQKPLQNL